jgi:UV DNA damage endonuclease
MNIGYACITIAVPGSELKGCTLKNAQPERLLPLIEHNLNALEKQIDYNAHNNILLFRISSDLIPFGSSVAADLPWADVYSEKLTRIGDKIRHAGMRVSMHPGQYTVLNSPNALVAERASADLAYHAAVLSRLGLGSAHKLILHVGGTYGDKKQAMSRFISRYKDLDTGIKQRLVLENDDKQFHISDVLETAAAAGLPVVYDVLHNAVNPSRDEGTDLDWIKRCRITWTEKDGAQKIHYSQQNTARKPGAHSESIRIDPFLDFCRQLPDIAPDIMLEVKDKNLSAVKCLNCVQDRGIGHLEEEWARYKYALLEHSPNGYQTIRQLLRVKSAYPALEMYRMIEASLEMPVVPGNGVNTAQYVWGYFKDKTSAAEKRHFQALLANYASGETGIQPVKKYLLRLADSYQEDYLLNGYYFYK